MDWNPQPMMSYGTFISIFVGSLFIASAVIEFIDKAKNRKN